MKEKNFEEFKKNIEKILELKKEDYGSYFKKEEIFEYIFSYENGEIQGKCSLKENDKGFSLFNLTISSHKDKFPQKLIECKKSYKGEIIMKSKKSKIEIKRFHFEPYFLKNFNKLKKIKYKEEASIKRINQDIELNKYFLRNEKIEELKKEIKYYLKKIELSERQKEVIISILTNYDEINFIDVEFTYHCFLLEFLINKRFDKLKKDRKENFKSQMLKEKEEEITKLENLCNTLLNNNEIQKIREEFRFHYTFKFKIKKVLECLEIKFEQKILKNIIEKRNGVHNITFGLEGKELPTKKEDNEFLKEYKYLKQLIFKIIKEY